MSGTGSTVQSNIGSTIAGLETWGEDALVGGEKLLVGIATKFGAAQISTLVAAATAYRNTLAAGGTATAAWNAAYAVLGQDESAAIAEAELGLADAIIELLGSVPTT